MMFWQILFLISLFMIFYVYIGYPAAVFVISLLKNKKVNKGAFEPEVTILIAAYNEEDHIEATLINKLNLDYPQNKLEIIVISDESTDGTDQIVKKYETSGVRLLRQIPRAGKTSALNMAVTEAKGELLVFSDANSIYSPDALRMLAENFHDPSVGYATGKMIYTNPDDTIIGDGCSAYMKYENFLRASETGIGSIVGVDGGIDAVRKELYLPMNDDQLPDFVLPLKVVEKGYRVVYEPGALLKEASLHTAGDEYKMRVRVSLRALWALNDLRRLLNIKKYTLFSWQLWSHKVLRYLCFIFLLTAYLSNCMLMHQNGFYYFLFIFQNIAYLSAAASPFIEKKGHKIKMLYFLNYFVLLNLAAAHAFIKFLFRKKQVLWTPRKG